MFTVSVRKSYMASGSLCFSVLISTKANRKHTKYLFIYLLIFLSRLAKSESILSRRPLF